MRISVQLHRPEFLKSDTHPTLKASFHESKDAPIDAANHAAMRMQALKQQSRASKARILGDFVLDTMTSPINENTSLEDYLFQKEITSVVKAVLTPEPRCGVPQLNEKAWATLHKFDEKRRAGKFLGSMPDEKNFQELSRIATNNDSPCREDAELLLDVMTRPINENTSLENYLSQKVAEPLYLNMEIEPDPDFRTFNSILPGLVINTQDYNSIGRTLLFKGATHLIGIPSTPTDTTDTLKENHLDRQRRLQEAIFHFPTQPAEGEAKLTLEDFDEMIDPLDSLNVYESLGPQRP